MEYAALHKDQCDYQELGLENRGRCTWHSRSSKPVSAPRDSSGLALDWAQRSVYRDCKKLPQVPPDPSRVRNPDLDDSG